MVNTWRSSYFQTPGRPRPVRDAAGVDRRVHPADDHPEAEGDRARDGRPHRAAHPGARATGRGRRPRPRLAGFRDRDQRAFADLAGAGALRRADRPPGARFLDRRSRQDALPAAARRPTSSPSCGPRSTRRGRPVGDWRTTRSTSGPSSRSCSARSARMPRRRPRGTPCSTCWRRPRPRPSRTPISAAIRGPAQGDGGDRRRQGRERLVRPFVGFGSRAINEQGLPLLPPRRRPGGRGLVPHVVGRPAVCVPRRQERRFGSGDLSVEPGPARPGHPPATGLSPRSPRGQVAGRRDLEARWRRTPCLYSPEPNWAADSHVGGRTPGAVPRFGSRPHRGARLSALSGRNQSQFSARPATDRRGPTAERSSGRNPSFSAGLSGFRRKSSLSGSTKRGSATIECVSKPRACQAARLPAGEFRLARRGSSRGCGPG